MKSIVDFLRMSPLKIAGMVFVILGLLYFLLQNPKNAFTFISPLDTFTETPSKPTMDPIVPPSADRDQPPVLSLAQVPEVEMHDIGAFLKKTTTGTKPYTKTKPYSAI